VIVTIVHGGVPAEYRPVGFWYTSQARDRRKTWDLSPPNLSILESHRMRPIACLALLGLSVAPVLLGPARAVAADPVVAVVAIDSYADVKSQVVMMATQFKGLAGLDAKRPLGVVVTASGELPVVHGYVPVKDLDRLLDVFKGTTGPVDQAGGKRLVTLPTGLRLEIAERDGWAVIAPVGSPAGPERPEQLIGELAETFSIGGQVFPARMPEGMRRRVREMIEQGADAAAAQGQPMDAAALDAAFEGLDETESLRFGLAIDPDGDQVFIESGSSMVPGTAGAAAWAAAAKTDNALRLPEAGDGKQAAILGHHAQAVPEATRLAVEATLAQALPAGSGDPLSDAVFGLVQDIIGGMLDTGGLDLGLAVDTSGVTADDLLPAITLAARIKDGPALEELVKNRVGKEGALPEEVTIRFDAGRVAAANLHEVEIDIAGTPLAANLGDTVRATLAVTDDRAFLLAGGDVAERIAAAVAAGAKPDPAAEPLTQLDLSVPGLLAFAATVATTTRPDEPLGEALATAAEDAAAKKSAMVRMTMRPIERGGVMRLAAEGGAIEAIAGAVTARATTVGPAGPGGGFPMPLERAAPAFAP
jgi:hypothetical protein